MRSSRTQQGSPDHAREVGPGEPPDGPGGGGGGTAAETELRRRRLGGAAGDLRLQMASDGSVEHFCGRFLRSSRTQRGSPDHAREVGHRLTFGLDENTIEDFLKDFLKQTMCKSACRFR